MPICRPSFSHVKSKVKLKFLMTTPIVTPVVTGGHFAKFQNVSPPRPYIEIVRKVDIIREN
jgi:hypothetical protein